MTLLYQVKDYQKVPKEQMQGQHHNYNSKIIILMTILVLLVENHKRMTLVLNQDKA